MALKAILDQEGFDALDEGLRAHYSPAADGKFYLDAEGVDGLPTVRSLVNTLKKFKAVAPDAERLQQRIAEANAIREAAGDLDAEGIAAALARLKELEEAGDKGRDLQAEIQRVKEALGKAHEKEIAKRDAEIQRLMRHVEDREIDQAIDAGLAKAGITPDTRAQVKAWLKEQRKPRVVWEDGVPRGVFTGELGDEIPITTYVEAWAKTDEAKPFLPPSGNEGTGAKNTTGGGGGGRTNPWMRETWNLTEQGRILRENPALAKQLAAAAGVKLQLAS